MDLGLAGRVALVAAASSGLGLGVARALAAEGAHVSICARGKERLASAHDEIDGAGPGTVISRVVDLEDTDAVTNWVNETVDVLGALHVVVTNSPGVPHGRADEFTPQEYQRAIDGCMLPHIAMTLAALPHLKAAGYGRILMITSEAVRQPLPGTALSAVARLGVLGYAKGLVHTLGTAGVTVNVLAPGCHRTPSFDGFVAAHGGDPQDAVARIAAELPLGRIGSAEDFGGVVAFLAGGQASFITGSVIVVDGGNTRGLA